MSKPIRKIMVRQSRLIQIRASAGSGKTFTLARNYMDLLARVNENASFADLAKQAGEILAVTFTNAAAEEMRQRVIANLKKASLGILEALPGETPFPSVVADKWLRVFLDDMSAVNIRTIDSLLHQIVHSCALDLGVNPDYITDFNVASALEAHVEHLLEDSRTDAHLRQILDGACDAILASEKDGSFAGGDTIRRNIESVLGDALAERFDDLSELTDLEAELPHSLGVVKDLVEQIFAILGNPKKNKVKTAFVKELEKWQQDQGNPSSKIFTKSDVVELYNKGGIPPDGLQELYTDLCCSIGNYQECAEMLAGARKWHPLIDVAQLMAKTFIANGQRDAVLPQARVGVLASSVLKPIGEVSSALCRMGDRISHYLVDEFQDTSQEQWNVLQALVLEALSQGGSMLWVGDPKQSIYGWRGGNPALFDEVSTDRQLRRVVPDMETQRLEQNFRSCPNIVEFNNKFFAPLSHSNSAYQILRPMIRENADGQVMAAAAQRVARDFADVKQKIPQKDFPRAGYVRVDNVQGRNSAEIHQNVLERLQQLLLEELRPRMSWSDVLILTRGNGFARELSENLAQWGIPAVTDNGLVLAENLLVRQLVAFLRFLDNQRDEVAFWSVLNGSIFSQLPEARSFSPHELLILTATRPNEEGLVTVFRKAWPELWDCLFQPFFQETALLTPYDLLMEWVKRTGTERRFPADVTMIRCFMEVVYRAESAGFGSISQFLTFWNDKGVEEKAPMPDGMNAVRIMTIHKAKGLESKVTIIPDTAFSLKGSEDIKVLPLGKGSMATKLNAHMRLAYEEDMCRQIQESLNLLYVAFTRPREELYVFYTQHMGRSTPKTASLAVGVLANAAGWDAFPIELGVRPHFANSPDKQKSCVFKNNVKVAEVLPDPLSDDWRPMGWLSQLKIFYTPLRGNELNSRELGIITHAALANWVPGADFQQSLDLAIAAAETAVNVRLAPKLRNELHASLAWLLGFEQVRRWLADGQTEQPMLDAAGTPLRVDLLAPNGSDWLVVDFKTGIPRDKDVQQVQRYMRCVRDAGQFSAKLQGLLIYMNLRQFQMVDFEVHGPLEPNLPKGVVDHE